MKQLYRQTPLILFKKLSKIANINIFLKMETLQPSFSFKNRGIGFICQSYAELGATKFISSSGGNAGLATAYSGRKLSIPVTVVVPETTSPTMVEKIQQESAEVIVFGKDFDEADSFAKTLLNGSSTYYISPFDHPLIWKGHSTIVDELVKENIKMDAILLAFGGGGLYNGVVEGLKRHGLDDVTVIASETEGAASFHKSILANQIIELEKIDTIATSLGAKKISTRSLELSKHHPTLSKVVSDKEALKASLSFADDHLTLVEPACGAPLSIVYNNDDILRKFKNIVVIVCGGANVGLNQLSTWKSKLGI